jgi:site-specific DNA-methyltransferase (adenine-specific)
MKIIPDKSIDMILCDLPYGTTVCKWDVIIPFKPLWEQYKRIIKDKGCIALFGSEPFSSYLRLSNIKEFRYDWIWKKNEATGGMNCNKMPLLDYETISIFYKKLSLYNPQLTKGCSYKIKRNKPSLDSVYGKTGTKNNFVSNNEGIRFPQRIVKFDVQRGLHPTQKPINLLSYLVKTYTKENETILDNCMGSGSTIVTCNYIDRKSIGIEMDRDIYELAIKRIKNPEQIIKEKKNKYSLFGDI